MWNNKFFEMPCPVSRNVLAALFSRIDKAQLVTYEDGTLTTKCDHTLAISRAFANENDYDPEPLIDWLCLHGGCCDCEVLMNTTVYFEDAIDFEDSNSAV